MQNLEIEDNKLNDILKEFNRINELLTYEEVLLDKKLFLHLEKQKLSMQPIVNKHLEYSNLQKNIIELEELIDTLESDEKDSFVSELEESRNRLGCVFIELNTLVNQFNASTQKILIEINIKENDNYLNILVNSYLNYCKNHSLHCERINNINSVILRISGANAKNIFISESGMHMFRNEREEASYQVLVTDDITEDIEINDKDIEIITCRSSGAGGQHINTTDSAIRAIHTPTGITAICQDERSQLQNKVKAIENLKNKVKEYFKNQKQKIIDSQKQEQIKALRKNQYAKIYDIEKDMIIKSNKDKISFKDFENGKVI